MYNEELLRKEAIAAYQKSKEKEYWLKKFDGQLPEIVIPYDRKTPAAVCRCDGEGDEDASQPSPAEQARVTFTVSGEAFTKLMRLCAGGDTRLHMVLITALTVLLNKYTGRRDVVLATPIYRQEKEGEFINTVLPIRNPLTENVTFKGLLLQVRQLLQEATKHQDYPIRILMRDLDLPAPDVSQDQHPLLDNALLLKNIQEEEYLDPVHPSLVYAFLRKDDRLEGEIRYPSLYYRESTVSKLAEHFAHILAAGLDNLDAPVDAVEMLTSEERQRLLVEFNRSEAPFPGDKTIHDLVRLQVEQTPDAVALLGSEEVYNADIHVTYRVLWEKSNQLARLLRKNGIEAEAVVGIMMERSPDTLIAILAILKCGAAYLPVETHLPPGRIQYMLRDSGAVMLLTQSKHTGELSFTSLRNFETGSQREIFVTPPRPHIREFNALPVPDRSLLDLRPYKGKIGMASVTDSISLQATRGCPYECLFCHKVWSKKHVFRDAESIFEEVLGYYRKGVTRFAFIDDCFNLSRKNSTRFYELVLKHKLDIKIFFPNGLRGDLLTPADIDLMVEAGVRGINLSLETASPRLQKLIRKDLDIPQFKEVMDYIAHKHPGVVLEIATMHGFPTETEEEAMLTLDFIEDIHWLHFPYIHILKIYPNTEMEALALEHGVLPKDIMASRNLAYHQLPDTLPFPKSFTRKYQSDFMNNYFLSKDRLRHVIPVQRDILGPEGMIQKYNAYLPVDITSVGDILTFTGLEELEQPGDFPGTSPAPAAAPTPELFDQAPAAQTGTDDPKRILFLDLSQHFSSENMLYNVAEQPLGVLSLLTYLKHRFGSAVDGRVYKSGNDFDDFGRLKELVLHYKPHLIGVRSLTYYKDFFHETVSLLKQILPDVPVIAGGPYATSDYDSLLKDRHVRLAVLGEGEYTMETLVRRMLENDFNIPSDDLLKQIEGIAFPRQTEGAVDASCEVLMTDRAAELISAQDTADVPVAAPSRNLAYVMYTSGSTGRPKGVMVEHRPVNNCIFWMQDKFNLSTGDAVIQRTNLSFDPSVWEMFWPLYRGGRVRILTEHQSRDASYLLKLMSGGGNADLMYCPSTLLGAMGYILDNDTAPRKLTMPWLVIGAEPVTMEVVKNFYRYYDGEIVNTYGPTEGTINNTWYHLHRDDSRGIVPIGYPVANNRLYILSDRRQLLPLEKAGEIGIAGDGLARGYVNDPEKTHHAFIPNPYGEGKLYLTGDVGRWWEDGAIEIMGRLDNQVKIRGHRIELGEVETALATLPGINDNVVTVWDSSASKKPVTTCKWCGITSEYPNTSIDEDGVCGVCANLHQYKETINEYFKSPGDLRHLMEEKNRDAGTTYDCLLAYNGGKGSAYALYQLVEQGFKVLAMSYDNGYFTKPDIENLKMITASLGVDHVILRHPNSDEIMREGMKTAATVCRGCFHASGSLAGQLARDKGIPVVVGATLSRGQIIENKAFMFLQQGITDVDRLESEIAELARMAPDIDKEIFRYVDIEGIRDGTIRQAVQFVDFYRYHDVSNADMADYLNDKNPYWETRKTYAVYSTNCPLKQVGDYGHLQEKGFHFYGSATSWEKRLGHITLENLARDLSCGVGEKGYLGVMKRLGYQPPEKKTASASAGVLCAYIVSDHEPEAGDMREQLSGQLPDYMIPSYFIRIDNIPLTPNGKIDRHALPEPRVETSEGYVAPRNDTEKKLADIWSRVLELDESGISVDGDFFELGGNSIKIMQVNSEINREFGFEISFRDFIQMGRISELAEFISDDSGDDSKKLTYPVITPDVENIAEPFPITDIQMAYLMGRSSSVELGGGSTHIYYEVRQPLDHVRLNRVWDRLVRRHPMLRAVVMDDGRQRILEDITGYDIAVEDLREMTPREQEKRIARERDRMSHYVFDPSQWPLFEIKGFILADENIHLCISLDPLVADAFSMVILSREVSDLYLDPDMELEPLEFTFRDYMLAYQELKASPLYLRDKNYWLDQLDDFPMPPALALRCDPATVENPRFNALNHQFSREEWKNLKKQAREHQVTPAALLCTAYAEVLAFWSNQPRMSINLTVFNRFPFHPDVDKLVGDFTSLILLGMDLGDTTSFWQRVRKVQDVLFEGLEHRHYDGVEFIRELARHHGLVNKAVMPVVFTCTLLDSGDGDEDPAAGDAGQDDESDTSAIAQTTQVYLDNAVVEGDGYLRVNWFFVDDLFEPEVIGTMFRQYIGILSGAAKGKDDYAFSLPPGDRELWDVYNRTGEDIPALTLQQLIYRQVDRTPDNAAVILGPERITYRELAERSARVARFLRSQGVRPNDLVGVLTPRRIETMVNVLGVLAAGAAYVPIDPGYPEDRRRYILENSRCTYMLQPDVYDARNLENLPGHRLENTTVPADIAYVIYTSGSTGRPKGVVISHREVTNTVIDINQKFNVDTGDRIMGISSMCFDLSVYDVFGAFSTGAALVLVKDQRDIQDLLDTLEIHRVSIWNSVPVIMNMAVNLLKEHSPDPIEINPLRLVMMSGDWIPLPLPDGIEHYFPGAEVISLGGATEGSIWSIYYPVNDVDPAWKSIPYGVPMANQTFYVLNYNRDFCPVNVAGELYIGGTGVAEGYMNDREKTESHFIHHPQLGRIYRTGDYGAFRRGGYIEFLGRIDHQVKIRGYRVELGEIETQLLAHPGVKDTVVIARDDQRGDKYLCAYIVPTPELDPGDHQLDRHLAGQLPQYMVPQYFVMLDGLPITHNGKLNRKALPVPDPGGRDSVRRDVTAPRDRVERELARIWAEALKLDVEHIGIDDNFFELGGHSLKATLLAARVHKTLEVKIPLQEIFKLQSIREQGEFIEGKSRDTYKVVEAAEKKDYYLLSSGQRRIYILQQMNESNAGYNMPSVELIEGTLDYGRLEHTFRELIRHYDSLRTSFHLKNDEIIQVVSQEVPFEIEHYTLPKPPAQDAPPAEQPPEAWMDVIEGFVRPFDLSRAPLLRVGLLCLGRSRHLLMVDMHHIISDGVSMEIFINGFLTLYKGGELPELKLQYTDFAQWQNSPGTKEALKAQEDYWVKEFSGEIPQLHLPVDYPRPPVQSFEGNILRFRLSAQETNQLNRLALDRGVTDFILLLTLFQVLVYRITGQEDIVTGTPVAGRRQEELNSILGIFINTLALRNYPGGPKTFKSFLEEVKARTLDAFENQDYQFEDLVDKLTVPRDAGRNPLLDIMFVWLNALETEKTGGAEPQGNGETLQFRQVDFMNRTSKFDLTFRCVAGGDQLNLEFQYCAKLFKEETIERFALYFKKVTAAVLQDPELPLADIDIMPDNERTRLLEEFNHGGTGAPPHKTIVHWFRDQVEKTPDAVAAAASGSEAGGLHRLQFLSYREMDRRAGLLAAELVNRRAGSNGIVAIIADPSPSMLIAILGILKAGAAYLPISPEHPDSRKRYMLADSGSRLLLTTRHLQEKNRDLFPDGCAGTQLVIDDGAMYRNDTAGAETLPNEEPQPESPAYVIYTSGSTGRPKGVMVEHRNVVNLVLGLNRGILDRLGPGLRMTLVASYIFDASVKQLFSALLNGHALYLVPAEFRMDGDLLLDFFNRYGIDITDGTPSHIRMLVENRRDALPALKLRHLVIGGEPLSRQTAEVFLNNCGDGGVRITNIYGPTECCVDSTCFEVSGENVHLYRDIPIGAPLVNQQVHILDGAGRVQPIGLPGEITIAGGNVSRGYLNRPELTHEKFIPGSFQPNNGRMYRTGDMGRYLQDGNIQFLGRIDQQVKINGFRIEPGEIENVLMAYDSIKGAVVMPRKVEASNGEPPGEETYVLAAYLVADVEVTVSQLRAFLSQGLPEYMIPSHFIQVERIPLTVSGKVDARALAEIDTAISSGVQYVEPENDTERQIAAVWQEVLRVEKVGRNESFFELGGSSHDIIKVNSKLKEKMNRNISVISMFRYPTVQTFSHFLDGEDGHGAGTKGKEREESIKKGKTVKQKRLQKKREKNQSNARRSPASRRNER